MRDIKQWSNWAKKDMSELDYLRKENRLLKENLEELEKRQIINRKNELTIHHLPIWPGSISAFIIAISTVPNVYKLKNAFIDAPFLQRFFYWNILFVGCLISYWLLHVILDLIFEKLDKVLSLGFYKKDNEFHWQKIIPFILYIVIMLIITILGPQ